MAGWVLGLRAGKKRCDAYQIKVREVEQRRFGAATHAGEEVQFCEQVDSLWKTSSEVTECMTGVDGMTGFSARLFSNITQHIWERLEKKEAPPRWVGGGTWEPDRSWGTQEGQGPSPYPLLAHVKEPLHAGSTSKRMVSVKSRCGTRFVLHGTGGSSDSASTDSDSLVINFC